MCRDKGPWGCQLHRLHESHQRCSWTVFGKQLWFEAQDPILSPSDTGGSETFVLWPWASVPWTAHTFHQSQRECRGSVGSSLPVTGLSISFHICKMELKILRPALQALGSGWLP